MSPILFCRFFTPSPLHTHCTVHLHVGMVPTSTMPIGQRMPVMANGMPQMVAPAGYMGKN